MNPDRTLLCAVGDDPSTIISDCQTGSVIAKLHGHLDYSFACAWSPDQRTIVTGNQDRTARWAFFHLISAL